MKRFAIAVIGGTSMLAALLSASAVRLSATASSTKWREGSLGSHAFGRLRAPDAIVATAGSDQVGFEQQGGGSGIGRWSIKVTPAGAVCLFDEVNHALPVSQSGS